MGMFDWINKMKSGKKATSKESAKSQESSEKISSGAISAFEGLNMKDAIDAHLAWYKKLERAIADKSAAGYEVRNVAADNNCALGGWIYKEAKKFSTLPEYETLRQSHADFHMLAGEILILVRDGDFEQATQRLRRDLRRASDHVQLNLIRLCTRANSS